ncbi:MAG: orotidine-5'-phosphate decarboxylase [Candidatus Hydrothermarchaeales archaeon]
MQLKRENGVIFAVDVGDKKRALVICEDVKGYVDAIKVGYPLILNAGIGIIEELKRFGKPVIADLKVADIPEISARICELAGRADYVIVHGFVGEDMVKACSDVVSIFVVAEMSHPGARDFMEECSEEIAALAKGYARGIVAPATRPERIKKLRKVVGDLLIISPGVKAQGAKVGDAIKAGADFEIIGRGIYEAEDPARAAKEFSGAIKGLLAN